MKNQIQSDTSFLMSNNVQIFILTLLAFVLYARTLDYKFVRFDDNILIVDNFKFISNPSNIFKAFNQDVFQVSGCYSKQKNFYRPMLTVSFMLDAVIAGISTKFFHFMNILYHLIVCVLLLQFLKQLKINPLSSFFLSLLFGLHPIVTQAVAWIPGRNDSLLTIFVLASFITLQLYSESKKRNKLLLHFLFFTCALFIKENALFVFPLAIFYRYFLLNLRSLKDNLQFIAGYVLIIILWLIMRHNALSGAEEIQNYSSYFNDFISGLPLYVQYISKSFIPYQLSVMSTVKDTNYIIGGIVISAIVLLIYFSKTKHWNYILFGLLWFFVFLTPSLLSAFKGGLEHRVYLPLIGFIILLGRLHYFENLSIKQTRSVSILFAITILFFIITSARLSAFSGSVAFWESAIETSEHSSLGNLNLGKTFEEEGNYNQALTLYLDGINRDSTQYMLYNNLAGLYLTLGDTTKAMKALSKEIHNHPENPFPYIVLGSIYKNQKQLNTAVVYWKKSITTNAHADRSIYKELCNYYKKNNDSLQYNFYCKLMEKNFEETY